MGQICDSPGEALAAAWAYCEEHSPYGCGYPVYQYHGGDESGFSGGIVSIHCETKPTGCSNGYSWPAYTCESLEQPPIGRYVMPDTGFGCYNSCVVLYEQQCDAQGRCVSIAIGDQPMTAEAKMTYTGEQCEGGEPPPPPLPDGPDCDAQGNCVSSDPPQVCGADEDCLPVPPEIHACSVGDGSALCRGNPPPDPPMPPVAGPPAPFPDATGHGKEDGQEFQWIYYGKDGGPSTECGPGTHLVGGTTCVSDSPPDNGGGAECGQGTHAQNGRCVQDAQDGSGGAGPDCGAGTHRSASGQCLPDLCPAGQVADPTGHCVGDTGAGPPGDSCTGEDCGTGESGNSGSCVVGYHDNGFGRCVPDGSDDRGQCGSGRHMENGECVPDGTASGGVTCGAEPTCSGDPIQCNVLHQTWASRCATEQLRTDLVGDGSALPDLGPDGDPSSVVRSETVGVADLDSGGFGMDRQCPAPIELSVMDVSWTIDTGPVCTVFDIAGILIMIGAYIQAARILSGSVA